MRTLLISIVLLLGACDSNSRVIKFTEQGVTGNDFTYRIDWTVKLDGAQGLAYYRADVSNIASNRYWNVWDFDFQLLDNNGIVIASCQTDVATDWTMLVQPQETETKNGTCQVPQSQILSIEAVKSTIRIRPPSDS